MLVKMHELVPSGDRMDTPSPGPRRLKKAASRSTLSPRAASKSQKYNNLKQRDLPLAISFRIC